MEISYDYDQWFNTVTITEPMNRSVESYQLDVQDRVEQATNVEGRTMDITYFVGGFVDTITRFDSSTIANTYDAAGRKDTTTYSPRTAGGSPAIVDNDYYADGQLKSITDTATTIQMGYTKLNQLKTATNTIVSAPSVTSVVDYAYDPVGNLESVITHIGTADPIETSYQYDDAERLWRITSETTGVGVFDYTYKTDNGRVDEIVNSATGITTTYTYDLMDRVKSITYDRNNVFMRAIAFSYYEDTSMIKDKTITGNGPTRKHAYAYDSLGRLTDEDIFVSNTKVSDVTYNYDLAGNRTTVVDNLTSTTSTYTSVPGTAGGNRLQSWGAHGIATYDAAGNTETLVSADGTVNLNDLNWDERYRLIDVSGTSGDITYGYDVQGRKISRTAGSPAVTEYYIYDGNQIVADVDASGNLLRSYAYGPGIDNILSMTTYTGGAVPVQTGRYYYLKDHQNSVIALTLYGNIVETYEYDAYGQILDVKDGSGTSIANQKSAIGNRYTFQGREIDWDTGLTYFRARWYNPETGRWLSKDPIGISGGMNLYAFCDSNPVNFVDPSGLCKQYSEDEWLKALLYGGKIGGKQWWKLYAKEEFGFNDLDLRDAWDNNLSLGAKYGIASGAVLGGAAYGYFGGEVNGDVSLGHINDWFNLGPSFDFLDDLSVEADDLQYDREDDRVNGTIWIHYKKALY